MNDRSFKVLVFNMVVVLALGVGFAYGAIQSFFWNDASHMTYVLAFLMTINIVLSTWDLIDPREWMRSFIRNSKGDFLFIGICGTLYGFSGLIGILEQAVQQVNNPERSQLTPDV